MNGEEVAIIIVILLVQEIYILILKLTYRYISANAMLTSIYVMMASLFLLV